MAKKLTKEEFVTKARAVHGDRYDYSESVLINTSTNINIRCKVHGEFHQTPSNHLKGKGCAACAGRARLNTDEFIKRSRLKHGDKYDYSKVAYLTNMDRVTIICPEHGPFEQIAATHMGGGGCGACAGVKKLTPEQFIAKARGVHGDRYDYSEAVYTTQLGKVKIICREHGAFWQTGGGHLAGKGCAKCAGTAPLDTETFIQRARAVHGDTYSYERTVYIKSNKHVVITCPVHGDFNQKPNNHLNGHGCFDCNQVGVAPMTHETFIEKATTIHGGRFDYSRVQYDRSRTYIEIGCPTHGVFTQWPEKHLAGQGCPSCAHSGPSKGQTEVSDFLSQHTEVVSEHPINGSNFRLDALLPEFGLGVEYHGLVWHSTRFISDPRKDYKKHKVAESHGIRVIHIYEDEWLKRRHVVERLLLSAIGKLPRVYARQTSLIRVSNDAAYKFYKANHLQGGRQSQVNLALVKDGHMVACMSFDMLRSSRYNIDRRHWELTRYASTVTVVGGASKLLKRFRSMGVADRLTSYSDSRAFSGRMYEALGFTLTHETAADYSYTTGRPEFGRRHKSAYQKKALAGMFPGCDLMKTEKQICEENGLYQIYDCGKKRWDMVL